MNFINNKKNVNVAHNNASYREYLVNNTNYLIEMNRNVFCNYKKFVPKSNNRKYIFNSVNDNNKPFGYECSDLKRIYLQNVQIKSNSSAPIITQEILRNFK